MNKKLIIHILGQILLIFGIVLFIPMIVGIIYDEKANTIVPFIIIGAICIAIGIFVTIFIKPTSKTILSREGIVITGLSWILLSFLGSLPFFISGEIPSFLDALFESVSGFTTTGTSIISQPLQELSHSMLFWRSLTHWLGGMGVLVFVLAVMPTIGPSSIQIMKQESTGPSVSKLAYKVKYTAQILYIIYILLTFIMQIMLLFGGMNLFDSFIIAFGTAGTGGFSLHPSSIAVYNSVYIEMVVAVFMFLFGVNFNVFFLMIMRKFADAFKNEELIAYVIIVFVSVILVAVNLMNLFGNFFESLRYSFFQVVSIITTTGFTTGQNIDISATLPFVKAIFMLLMFFGACSGSTSGGMKIIRPILLIKSAKAKSRAVTNPRAVEIVKINGKRIDEKIINIVLAFFVIYVIIIILGAIIISASGLGFEESLSASLSSISNVGVHFNTKAIGDYEWYVKVVMMIQMLMGRLELFPIILLFSPKLWRKFS